MAQMEPVSARINFRLDLGVTEGDKRVCRTVTLNRVDGSIDTADIVACASELAEMLEGDLEYKRLVRVDDLTD